MTNGDNVFRRAQRLWKDGKRAGSRTLEESGAVEIIAKGGEKVGRLVSQKYQEYEVDRVVQPAARSLRTTYDSIAEKTSETDKSLGISRRTKSAVQSLDQVVMEPAKQYLDDTGVSEVTQVMFRRASDEYGAARSSIKPYFAPESAQELLENTRHELAAITACILQVSHHEAGDWLGNFGKLASAKFAGAAGTLTLFGLVSTFGSAGTGTAIAGLSGAAANSATLAAIGGTVGGGMAAGALVLSGFGILVGIGAYKLMSSTAREYDTLPEEDKQIVNTAGVLSAAVQEVLDRNEVELSDYEATQFLQSMEAFQRNLEDNQDEICSRLDALNSLAFRQHAVPDFKIVVVRDFKQYAKTTSAITDGVIGGVFYALLTQTALDGSPEQSLVLDALRRSDGHLKDASEAEISKHLHSLDPEQMQGVANNVKGIYHELRYVEKYNAEHQDSYAVLHPATNHQGSDVQIISKDTGEPLGEIQLKATNSVSYVKEHQSRYDNIEVKATSEVSERIEGVETSGFSNDKLTQQINGTFEDLAGNTISDRMIESAEITGLAAAGLETIKALREGSDAGEAGKRIAGTVVSASAATGITAFLFS